MLKFTIIDYTTNPLGDSTVIDEPVGWDAIGMRLRRAESWHGFFDFFDDSYSSMQFVGTGLSVLKTAFEQHGTEADVKLLIEYACSDTDTYEELYLGNFVFTRYAYVCADYCYIEIGVENANCLMKFRNRIDQKVDLDSLETFDHTCTDEVENELGGGFGAGTSTITVLDNLNGLRPGDLITITGSASNDGTYTIVTVAAGESSTGITVAETLVDEFPSTFTIAGCLYKVELEPYDGLNKEAIIPAKPIQTQSLVQKGINKNFSQGFPVPQPTDFTLLFSPNFEENPIAENVAIYPTITPDSAIFEEPNFVGPIYVKAAQDTTLVCSTGDDDISYRLKGSIRLFSGAFPNDCTFEFSGVDILLLYKRTTTTVINRAVIHGPEVGRTDITITFDESYAGNPAVAVGDELHLILQVEQFIATQQNVGQLSNVVGFELVWDDECFFKILSTSICEPTIGKLYQINEALSRTTEIITNDCLRVFSNYFGRTDAQPYTSEADGCGALEAITNGLKIRVKDEDKIVVGTTEYYPKMFVSMKELFEGLRAIHNIGMGIEDDPNRAGYQLVRIEPIHYFYQTGVLMSCTGVREVRHEVDLGRIMATIKIGYQKWETENFNGLNDVFGQREYRTTLSNTDNTYDQLCRFIASDYAIEVTRRQFGQTTKDWRYDNDLFILCLSRLCSLAVFDEETSKITLVLPGLIDFFEVGDSITITGSVSNDGTYTINNVELGTLFSTELTVDEAITDETTPVTICITNNTNPRLRVEQDIVANSTDILYPEYCLNLRITPVRNLLRHFRGLINCYRNYLNGQLKFTAGTGNYIAQIELSVFDCLNEAAETELPENGNVTYDTFEEPENHYPLFWPETVQFDYPVTYAQYKAIKANPYGLVEYQCGNGPTLQGWIKDFKYKPYEGMAEFTLIPKIPTE